MKKIKTLIIVLMLIALPSTTFAYTELQLKDMQIRALQTIIELLIQRIDILQRQFFVGIYEKTELQAVNPNREIYPVQEAVIVEPKKEKPEGWYSIDRPCFDMTKYAFSDKTKKCYLLSAYQRNVYFR